MSEDTNKIIRSIIPKDEILNAFKNNDPDTIEDMMYEIADNDALFQSYIELDLPEVLYKICEESIKYLLESQDKELVISIFKDVTDNIRYIEDKPVPYNFFEQFNK